MDAPLRRVPGIGKAMEADLHDLGIFAVEDLKGRDPDELYARLTVRHGGTLDRCVLYVFRCAVYYAETADPEPELLKWWSWKDAAEPPLHLLGSAIA